MAYSVQRLQFPYKTTHCSNNSNSIYPHNKNNKNSKNNENNENHKNNKNNKNIRA